MENVLVRKKKASLVRLTKEDSDYLLMRSDIMDSLFPEDGSYVLVSAIPHKFRTLAARKVINKLIVSGELCIRYLLDEKSPANNKLIIKRVDCFLLKRVAVEYAE